MYLEKPLSDTPVLISPFATGTLAVLFVGTLLFGVYWAPLADLAETSTAIFLNGSDAVQAMVR